MAIARSSAPLPELAGSTEPYRAAASCLGRNSALSLVLFLSTVLMLPPAASPCTGGTAPPRRWSSSPGDMAPALGSKKREGKPESAPSPPVSPVPPSLPIPPHPHAPPSPRDGKVQRCSEKRLGCQDAIPPNAAPWWETTNINLPWGCSVFRKERASSPGERSQQLPGR